MSTILNLTQYYDADYSADGLTCAEWTLDPDEWGLYYLTVYTLDDDVWKTDTLEAYDSWEALQEYVRVVLDIADPPR